MTPERTEQWVLAKPEQGSSKREFTDHVADIGLDWEPRTDSFTSASDDTDLFLFLVASLPEDEETETLYPGEEEQDGEGDIDDCMGILLCPVRRNLSVQDTNSTVYRSIRVGSWDSFAGDGLGTTFFKRLPKTQVEII